MNTQVREILAPELRMWLSNDAPPLAVDVREAFELREGVIPGALHIPMNWIPARLDELPRDRDLVIHCSHGERSYDVAAWLVGQGFERVSSLAGGMEAWKQLRAD